MNSKQAEAVSRYLRGLPLTKAQRRQVRKAIGTQESTEWRVFGCQQGGLPVDQLTREIARGHAPRETDDE